MTVAAKPTRVSLLIMEGWEGGFCPTHFGVPGARCNQWCLPARAELAKIQADYEKHWRLVARTGWAT